MNIDISAYEWSLVEAFNKSLCENVGVAFGRSTDGYEKAKTLWEKSPRHLPLEDALKLAHQCHRAAPFLNYNGNTFVAIFKLIIPEQISLPAIQKSALNSAVGHYIAGTILPEEERMLKLLTTSSLEKLKVGDQVQSLKGNIHGEIKEILSDGTTWIKTAVMGTVKTSLDAVIKVAREK